MAGRQHRIDQDENAALGLRQLHVIFDRPLGLVVAVETDMAHARRRQQFHQAVRHAEAGAQDRHHGDLLALDDRRIHLGERRLDLLRRHRQVAGELIAHQQRDLLQQLPEQGGRRRLVAHHGELVLDQRMIEHIERREFLEGLDHGPLPVPVTMGCCVLVVVR